MLTPFLSQRFISQMGGGRRCAGLGRSYVSTDTHSPVSPLFVPNTDLHRKIRKNCAVAGVVSVSKDNANKPRKVT